MMTFMRLRLGTAAASTSRKALNVRLRTVIRGLRSSRLVISRIPIGLSVAANATIDPAIAKSAIRDGEAIDSQTASGAGKAAHGKETYVIEAPSRLRGRAALPN